jgi:small subunit ribosomal protein S7
MRHKRAPKRKIAPDLKYKSEKIAKFINYVMRRGKKTLAQKIVYRSFDLIKEKTKKDPLKVFEQAVENAGPLVEVKPRRIGGANYQIPFPVNEARRFALACRWLIEAAKSKKGKPMAEKLAEEIILAAENQGAAVKKKEDTHKMAEANRAFAHLARFVK